MGTLKGGSSQWRGVASLARRQLPSEKHNQAKNLSYPGVHSRERGLCPLQFCGRMSQSADAYPRGHHARVRLFGNFKEACYRRSTRFGNQRSDSGSRRCRIEGLIQFLVYRLHGRPRPAFPKYPAIVLHSQPSSRGLKNRSPAVPLKPRGARSMAFLSPPRTQHLHSGLLSVGECKGKPGRFLKEDFHSLWVLIFKRRRRAFQSGLLTRPVRLRRVRRNPRRAGQMAGEVGRTSGEARHAVMLLTGLRRGDCRVYRARTTGGIEAAFSFLAIIVGATRFYLVMHSRKLTEDQGKFATSVQNAF